MRQVSSPELEQALDVLSDDDVAVASERTPAFDIAAVASVAGLRDTRGQVPLDACVPTRTDVPPPPGLDLATLLVFAHVDGVLSLDEIAACAKLSLSETIESFLRLLALGVVTAPPVSGCLPTAASPTA